MRGPVLAQGSRQATYIVCLLLVVSLPAVSGVPAYRRPICSPVYPGGYRGLLEKAADRSQAETDLALCG